jgi:hypothetical protein
MAGQNGLAPAADEAARLEAALARIARAASVAAARRAAPHGGALPPLHGPAAHATTAPGGPDTADIAARLDGLIAEIRTLLRTPDM